jgi:hypothetical protein
VQAPTTAEQLGCSGLIGLIYDYEAWLKAADPKRWAAWIRGEGLT